MTAHPDGARAFHIGLLVVDEDTVLRRGAMGFGGQQIDLGVGLGEAAFVRKNRGPEPVETEMLADEGPMDGVGVGAQHERRLFGPVAGEGEHVVFRREVARPHATERRDVDQRSKPAREVFVHRLGPAAADAQTAFAKGGENRFAVAIAEQADETVGENLVVVIDENAADVENEARGQAAVQPPRPSRSCGRYRAL